MHARSTCYDAKGTAIQASSVNKIMEQRETEPGRKQGSEEYLAKVKEILERLNEAGE